MEIHAVATQALSAQEREEILALCHAAYDEDLRDTLASLGPGTHLLGRVDGRIVTHLLIVPRALQPQGFAPLHTGYVELVATLPAAQRRGHGSALLRAAVARLQHYDIAGLSPSDARFYARLGWEMWRGPLSVRMPRGVEATPGEELMVLRLPRTPAALDLGTAASIEWRPGDVW